MGTEAVRSINEESRDPCHKPKGRVVSGGPGSRYRWGMTVDLSRHEVPPRCRTGVPEVSLGPDEAGG